MYFGGNPQKISCHILVQLMNEWDSLINIHHVQGCHRGKTAKIDVWILQCWTEGRSSTAVAEDLGPTATATVAEV